MCWLLIDKHFKSNLIYLHTLSQTVALILVISFSLWMKSKKTFLFMIVLIVVFAVHGLSAIYIEKRVLFYHHKFASVVLLSRRLNQFMFPLPKNLKGERYEFPQHKYLNFEDFIQNEFIEIWSRTELQKTIEKISSICLEEVPRCIRFQVWARFNHTIISWVVFSFQKSQNVPCSKIRRLTD